MAHVSERIDKLLDTLERVKLEEYFSYATNRRRMLLDNFVGGLSRGVGMAIGFSLLGALVVMLIQRIAAANLPGISEFIARLVIMVEGNM